MVPGEGSFAENSILLLGIAPGAVENKLGRPFVGPSGEVLRKAIRSVGLCLYASNIEGLVCTTHGVGIPWGRIVRYPSGLCFGIADSSLSGTAVLAVPDGVLLSGTATSLAEAQKMLLPLSIHTGDDPFAVIYHRPDHPMSFETDEEASGQPETHSGLDYSLGTVSLLSYPEYQRNRLHQRIPQDMEQCSLFHSTRFGVYITNAVKHRPPGNRNPKPSEKAACLPYLQAELEEWEGRVVVALGESAVRFFAPTARTLTPLIGRPIPIGAGRVVIPSYHPSNVVRGQVGEEVIAEAILLARDVALGKVEVGHTATDYRMWDGENIWNEIEGNGELVIGLDTESAGWEPFGLSISIADGQGYWVRRDQVRRWWVRGMEETWGDIPIAMHFAPHDLVVLEQMGIPWPDTIDDTQVLARLKGYDIGLKALVLALFGYVMTTFEELVSAVGGKLDEVTEDALIGYAVADADFTRKAWFKLKF